jgi:hypothetical protein
MHPTNRIRAVPREVCLAKVKALLQFVGFAAIAGCAAAGSPASLSVDKTVVTFDGLHPVVSDFFDRVYVADPLYLSGYTRILPQGQGGEFRHPAAENRATGEQIVISIENRARFQAELASAVSNKLALAERFKIASAAAEDALSLWGTLVDINARVEEDGTEIAEFILVLELRDSITDTTLVRAVHPYQVPLDHNDPDRSWAKLAGVLDSIALTIGNRLEGLIAQSAHQ